jgi:hypothetical protein
MQFSEDQQVHYMNARIYVSEPEQGYISCTGCVFNKPDAEDYNFCSCECSTMTQKCYEKQLIWKEHESPMVKKTKDEEPKFTVEQVLLAVGEHLKEKGPVLSGFKVTIPAAVTWIKQYLAQQQDPEYQLYAKLKQKYEQVC